MLNNQPLATSVRPWLKADVGAVTLCVVLYNTWLCLFLYPHYLLFSFGLTAFIL